MKIIVGGAGSVGQSIVTYLSQGNNDIIVIDTDAQKLNDIAQSNDIRPIRGSISHPNILEKAGAKSADLLIAATDSDETNMIACQIAYSLFGVSQRIARLDNDVYLSPLWSTLYNENNIPIDFIISPAKAIASVVYRLLKLPGSCEYLSFFDNTLKLISFSCFANCPLLQTPLEQINLIFPDFEASFLSIERNGRTFIPTPSDVLQQGDIISFLVKADKIDEAIHAFAMEKPVIERVIIFGGGNIALHLARKLEEDDSIQNIKIIDENTNSARFLAKELNNSIVINGKMLNDAILEEAAIERADVAIALTENDKDNLLVSLLACSKGASSIVSLVNSPNSNNLWKNLGDNILVHRASVTISSLLKEVRSNRIEFACSLGSGRGEIWVVEIDENSHIAEHRISSLRLSTGIKIGAIQRDNNIIFPPNSEYLRLGDKLIVYVNSAQIRRAEQIFS